MPKYTRFCAECNNEFECRDKHHWRSATFCSRQCRGHAHSKMKVAQRQKKKCPTCGDFFSDRSSKLSKRKYCSTACSNKARARPVFAECEYCGKEYKKRSSRPTRFCSTECLASAQSTSLDRDEKGRKQCNKCGEWRYESYFTTGHSKDGLRTVCKFCDKSNHHKRRTMKKDAPGSFSGRDIEKMLIGQNYKCWYCGSSIKGGYHVDHWIPLSKGGSNDPGNLRIACKKCNLSKGAKMPHEWEGSNGLLL